MIADTSFSSIHTCGSRYIIKRDDMLIPYKTGHTKLFITFFIKKQKTNLNMYNINFISKIFKTITRLLNLEKLTPRDGPHMFIGKKITEIGSPYIHREKNYWERIPIYSSQKKLPRESPHIFIEKKITEIGSPSVKRKKIIGRGSPSVH